MAVNEGCKCILCLRRCPNEPEDNHITTYFDSIEVDRTVSAGSNVYKYTSEDKLVTKRRFDIIGTGGECATSSQCFDDFYRGGFSIDLTDSGFVFSNLTTINTWGSSNSIRVKVDGVVYFTGSGGGVIDIPGIPSGSNKVEVVCGGWCCNCTLW